MRQCQKYAIWDVTSSTWGSGGSCDKSCSHLRRLESSPSWRSPFLHPRSRRWRWTCRRRGGGRPSHRSAVSSCPAQHHNRLEKEHLEKENEMDIVHPRVLKNISSTYLEQGTEKGREHSQGALGQRQSPSNRLESFRSGTSSLFSWSQGTDQEKSTEQENRTWYMTTNFEILRLSLFFLQIQIIFAQIFAKSF